jgi:hypothetical protein
MTNDREYSVCVDTVDLSTLPGPILALRAYALALMCIDRRRVEGEDSDMYRYASRNLDAMVTELNKRFVSEAQ